MVSLLTLFLLSFLAATILPVSSEIALLAMLNNGSSLPSLLIVASAGNTLGAALNWALGRFLLHYRNRSWFFFSEKQLCAAQRWFHRYGLWSLLFSWLPVCGDVLTCVAGIMRVRFWLFLLLVGLGKTSRYAVVLYVAHAQLSP